MNGIHGPPHLRDRGRGLPPYSVITPGSTRVGSNNIPMTWVRRSRVLGNVENTTVPIGEATESYEIDIINNGSPSDEVLRTLTATSESVIYSAADQNTDFGDTVNPVIVKIYQISADVGRGVVTEALL